jgi:peptidoglycan/xylan/chitin deacetylase (PgdA/CDA1 family)
VGHVTGRVAMGLAVLLAAAYLLQADDSHHAAGAGPAPAVSLQLGPVLVARADTGGREYFIRHGEIVPLGAATIRLPILMYHYIRKPPPMRADMIGFRLSVAPEVFQTQLDWLRANGYHTVTFTQVRAYFAGTEALPSRPIIITFDDGYEDLYTTAFPILRAHGFAAVAYIVTGFVDQPAYVTHAQVIEMDGAGMDIASHTVNHADLSRTSFGTTLMEAVQSRRWLEQLLHHPVLDFAYPSGKFSPQAIEAVRQAGYFTAVTTSRASTTHSLLDRFEWGRVRVGGGESMQEFITNLGASMASVRIANIDVEALPVYPEHRYRQDA